MNGYYNKWILKNGMTIKSIEMTSVHSVTISLFVPVCTSLIEKKTKGIYHFLEHMVFRRLNGMTQKEIYYHTEKIGGTLRGVTYPDYIQFSVTVLPKYFSQAMEIMRKVIMPISWEHEDIAAEKKVVMNQIRFQNYYSFEKRIDKVYYEGTGYEYEIMGSQSSVRAFSKSYVNLMREMVFAVQNCCMVIAGNVTEEWIRNEMVKIELLQPSKNVLIHSIKHPKRFEHRTNEDILLMTPIYDNAEIMLSFDVPQTMNVSNVEFLCGIIGQGDGGLLSVDLRENLSYTNEIYSYVQQTRYSTKLVIQCETAHEHVVECIYEIFRILDLVKKEIDEDCYLSAKPFYTENREMMYDSTEKMADWIGYRYIYPDSFETVDQQIRYCEAISIEQLKQCASELFVGKNMHIAVSCLRKEKSLIKQIAETWRSNHKEDLEKCSV